MANVLTVSQFVESIRGLLRETFTAVTVQGEVTGYRTARNGTLIYFEIKDDVSRVLCFALNHEIKVALTDGMEVRVTASPSLFKGNGGFHLRVIEVELVGEGALRKQFELTKKRLEAEGLFRPARKRALPAFPNAIGIVTSPDAAAYTDVLRILRNRWPLVRVQLAGVAVQGPGAARQIVRALEKFSAVGSVDVIILTRGGGSLEDLQAFNDEGVARAIFGSAVPVVVGVGHERDETIADYVADQRASTPSNAAERVVPDRSDILRRIDVMTGQQSRSVAATIEVEHRNVDGLVGRIGASLQHRMHRLDLAIERFVGSVGSFSGRLAVFRSTIESRQAAINGRLKTVVGQARQQLAAAAQRLHALSPTAILKRGYSVTRTADGRILKRSRDVQPGRAITTVLGSGEISSTVTKTI
ncbi:MAG: exodeoxyribonuclease VII large subunit [Candidatus Kerfeldbacteria bacterium]|nr:exodeoxyribonuclease VII large subunit [Candidatus Kerfeldbacteria bacterium]